MATVADHHSAFGEDAFGRAAEKTARFFGTPRYIIGQTVVVALWVALNSVAIISHWDPYPFILLNLGFSLQAAYAAPLILLAQTRQADRDKAHEDLIEKFHRRAEQEAERRIELIKAQADKLTQLLQANTDLTRADKELTEQVATLTKEIHTALRARA